MAYKKVIHNCQQVHYIVQLYWPYIQSFTEFEKKNMHIQS